MSKSHYEGFFLLPGNAEVEPSLKRIKDIIERHEGKITVIKKWDERKLAYEIKKQKRGLYILAYFTAPGAAVAQITRDVNLSDDVLRVLITDASHLTTDEMAKVEPQPIAPREPMTPSYDVPPGFSSVNVGGDRGDRPSRGGPRGRREEESNA